VDTTGAGDAFRAGLIYSLLQGGDLRAAVAFAAAAGALKITASGSADGAPAVEVVSQVAGGLLVVEG
jgi:sugar/nucleoside kinase (ribokinase family)